ncbi:MAG: hypothetical protein GY830_05775 [Bacteroidetes bacterium]|nr:hypothetical protein [Bacteroidota bacterium]
MCRSASPSDPFFYSPIIENFDNEFTFLQKTPLNDIKNKLGPIYELAIQRLRNQEVNIILDMMGYLVKLNYLMKTKLIL